MIPRLAIFVAFITTLKGGITNDLRSDDKILEINKFPAFERVLVHRRFATLALGHSIQCGAMEHFKTYHKPIE